jgi:phosphotriesterase-related protein
MLREHPNRLLLSHDAGWYQVGEPKQNVRGFTYLMEGFLPALRRAGVTEAQIRQITVQNPAQAFALRAA